MNHPILYAHYFHFISRSLKNVMDHTLKECDLTKSQSDVLRFLSSHRDEIIVQKDIENDLKISNPTVTGLLNRLEQKKFIQRLSHPTDKRAKQIVLTPKAFEMESMIKNQIEVNEENLLKGFSNEEKELFLAFLQRSLQNISKEVKHD
ncbi:MarR family winged helix-turn-helix transcriptional regulator [Floccifex sp.]|uniref:MarR family winged helix-turn-helix transcriptional regulator n=1 Tax=Floccifex sp. TaxID=2815810 RepID=UPI003EFCFFC5